MKDRPGQLAVCLVQGIEGHDLHGQDGRREFRAAEDVHQGRALGQGKAGKIGRHHVKQGGETGQQPGHGHAVLLAPGDGKLAHDQGGHGGDKKKTGHA